MAHLSHLMVCSSLYVWILCICMPDHLTPDRPTTHDEPASPKRPTCLLARFALLAMLFLIAFRQFLLYTEYTATQTTTALLKKPKQTLQ